MSEFNPFRYLVFTGLPAGHGNNQAPKYSLGDKVHHVPSKADGAIGTQPDMVNGVYIYWFQMDGGGGTYAKEHELYSITTPQVPEWKWGEYKCECGSEKTYGKDSMLHASYCPKFRG